ncbi:MAG: ATP-dependent DNA helicase [Acidimicrobiia bacterium]
MAGTVASSSNSGSRDLAVVLEHVVGGLPGGGEPRLGQREMADAVRAAIAGGRHLIVQAGTGTGKSLGYLVPAVLSGKRVVVATATKALQDQLASKDLPYLQSALPELDITFAVVKGRSNYACLQRLKETSASAAERLDLDDVSPAVRAELRKIAAWAETSKTGDRGELDFEPMERAWQAASVTSNECPGANTCPMGGSCFAERARRAAAEANVIVVNLHLYGTHLASGGVVLPEHDLVIVDEAHQLEDTISSTSGLELTGGRFVALSRIGRGVLADEEIPASVATAGSRLAAALTEHNGKRLTSPLPSGVQDALIAGRATLAHLLESLRRIDTSVNEADQRKVRAQTAATGLIEELDAAMTVPKAAVAWVEGDNANPRLRIAPIDVGPVLEMGLWEQHPTILTSATIPMALPDRIGLVEGTYDVLDVGSPFDYEHQGLIYCTKGFPDPRRESARFDAAVHEELQLLIEAAGGRTLALFTSWRAMREAVAAVSDSLDHKVLVQGELPNPMLAAEFARDETSCLFATASFFQGIDIPGRALSLVTIDRLPFPRPDEPLLQARRELAGQRDAFRLVDLPRAATLLAQAAGRLIRSATDRGVVAVFDPRLATAGYRWDIVQALPAMRRTADRDEALDFLRRL